MRTIPRIYICTRPGTRKHEPTREEYKKKAKRKQDLYQKYVSNKDVLHLGAGGGDAGRPGKPGWFHGWLDKQSTNCVGLDIDKSAVDTATDLGFDLYQSDVQKFNLSQSFDVVVAPNIIEHLCCPGGMLECAREHLRPDGCLVLTTPRPNIPWWTAQAIINGGDPEPHPEHTMWLGPSTLRELLSRKSFEVTEYKTWTFDRSGMSIKDSL